ncbi:MAG: DUF86 domain-containing protein [Anaerolineae bacterium]|nr:DUF86 domain-containing protein [Anaerolineae bacterium]MCB0200359.1 DUF86 domain-containing protein [Anaerolineae bacterium]MCB0254298.1 DUF86 domain-containing protein [Anaerolineae bacterium]
MSTREWRERVRDILDAIDEIDAFTSGMERETFQDDYKTVRAVELNLIIIGEAANGISDDIQQSYNDIPWSFMKAMRNRLVHAYFNVDPQILWDTVLDDLPPLKTALQRLVTNPSPDQAPDKDDS